MAVTSPLTKSNNRLENPCEEYALSQKHGKYDKGFVGQSYSFCAMVWETLGAINSEGEDVLHSLFRFAAKQLGREFSSYCGRAWARISCCLQRSVSQAILTRIDGRELPRVEPSGPDRFVTVPEASPPLASLPPSSATFASRPPAAMVVSPVRVTPPSPPSSVPSVLPASAIGGVVAVRADGDCCYHLCAVIGELMRDVQTVQCGFTNWSPATTATARSHHGHNVR